MKNLFILFLLVAYNSFAQLSVRKVDNTIINTGDTFNFNQLTDPEAYLGIKVFNTSLVDDINVKIKVESITNANGTDVQLCFGNLCFGTIIAGNNYPNLPITLSPGQSNGRFDHFINFNSGTVSGVDVIYVFKFYLVDGNGTEIGNSVTFSYKYNPNLSSSNFESESKKVKFYPNPSSGILKIDTESQLKISVTNLIGKVVYTNDSVVNNTNIDLSNLQKGIYLVNVVGENTNTTEKLILN